MDSNGSVGAGFAIASIKSSVLLVADYSLDLRGI